MKRFKYFLQQSLQLRPVSDRAIGPYSWMLSCIQQCPRSVHVHRKKKKKRKRTLENKFSPCEREVSRVTPGRNLDQDT